MSLLNVRPAKLRQTKFPFAGRQLGAYAIMKPTKEQHQNHWTEGYSVPANDRKPAPLLNRWGGVASEALKGTMLNRLVYSRRTNTTEYLSE